MGCKNFNFLDVPGIKPWFFIVKKLFLNNMQENCKIYERFKFDTFLFPSIQFYTAYCLLINNLHHTMLSVHPEMEFKEF